LLIPEEFEALASMSETHKNENDKPNVVNNDEPNGVNNEPNGVENDNPNGVSNNPNDINTMSLDVWEDLKKFTFDQRRSAEEK